MNTDYIIWNIYSYNINMELAIPLVALSGLYVIKNQNKKKEDFSNHSKLPNTNTPDSNY